MVIEGGVPADEHFKVTSFEQNIPVVMALIGIWYRNFYGTSTGKKCDPPYDQYLHRLPLFPAGKYGKQRKYIGIGNGSSCPY